MLLDDVIFQGPIAMQHGTATNAGQLLRPIRLLSSNVQWLGHKWPTTGLRLAK